MRMAAWSSSTVPASGWCTPVRILTSVDLPAPFSPISAVMLPRCNCRSTPASARTPPKDLRTLVSLSRGACTGGRSWSEHLRVLTHVADVVDEGLAHRTYTIGSESDFTHPPHVHRLVRVLAACQAHGNLRGGVAEIHRVPDGELRHHSFLHVSDQFGWQAQARDLDLAGQSLVFHGTRRRDDSHRADAHQHDQVRMLLKQRRGF